ncbi:hypothetical protein [Acetobacter thailandicus]|uniref:hypothetical protein n=1 Tax=Acetobacter thailandicus TaxID=1502842 RepID=UPI001BAA6C7A|nr:hypothetical protein [Acetobacter thailandicus]MBS0981528.1 hypothetical protein [Acetobacter thailandicus]
MIIKNFHFREYCFFLSAFCLILGALLHVSAWLAGPEWMAELGAPPSIVLSTAARSYLAILVTLGITLILCILSLCCVLIARNSKKYFNSYITNSMGNYVLITRIYSFPCYHYWKKRLAHAIW